MKNYYRCLQLSDFVYCNLQKTQQYSNFSFTKKIFELSMTNHPTRAFYKINPEIRKLNQVRFETKSLKFIGPKFETICQII